MYEEEEVNQEEAKEFAEEIGAIFEFTSPRNGIGIEELFRSIGYKYLNLKYKDEKDDSKKIEIKIKSDNKSKENKGKKKEGFGFLSLFKKNKTSNSSSDDEIKELKEKLNKANKIIEKQKLEIQELKKQINSNKSKNIDMNQINNLQNEIINKNNQLEKLKQQLNNISTNNQNNNQINTQNDKCVNFITTDESLIYAIPCNGNSTFAEVEEKLYKEYPEYRETNNTFFANGIEILRNKTINENKVGNGKPVILFKPS